MNFRIPMLTLLSVLVVAMTPLHSVIAAEEIKMQATATWQSKGSLFLGDVPFDVEKTVADVADY